MGSLVSSTTESWLDTFCVTVVTLGIVWITDVVNVSIPLTVPVNDSDME